MFIFTRDLGLVGAHAQSTRRVDSKLRYALDAPSRSTVSLVRGKNMWRLKSAVPDKRFYSVFKENQEKFKLCTRTFSLLKKLLAGEEANAPLFDLVNNFLDFLEEKEITDVNDFKNLETIIMLRILYVLGYVPENDLTRQFAHSTEWTMEIIKAIEPQRKEAVVIINESLRASEL